MTTRKPTASTIELVTEPNLWCCRAANERSLSSNTECQQRETSNCWQQIENGSLHQGPCQHAACPAGVEVLPVKQLTSPRMEFTAIE